MPWGRGGVIIVAKKVVCYIALMTDSASSSIVIVVVNDFENFSNSIKGFVFKIIDKYELKFMNERDVL